jgi:biopolymer transport protein ExbB
MRVPVWLVAALLVAGLGHWLSAQGQQGQPQAQQPQAQQARPGAPAGQEAAGVQAIVQQADRESHISFLELLIKGGVFMWPIAAVSLVGLALIIERLMALQVRKVVPRGAWNGIRSSRDTDSALEYCRTHDNPLTRVIASGIRQLPKGEQAVEQAMADTGANEVHKMRRNLRMIYAVSAVSPMLGLLGTVWGLIEAFRITSAASGLGKPELLAKGIYEALVTTLAGLIVAIPVLMFYYYFIGKIERIISELNDVTMEFIDTYVRGPVRRTRTREPQPQPQLQAEPR